MIVLILFFSFLLFHYIYFLNRISLGIKKVSEHKDCEIAQEFISIIIPFRNEEKNILNSLKSLTKQKYPKTHYEVIYIDDNSEDKSFKLLEDAEKPENVVLLKSPAINQINAHKKKALRHAIENAKGEIIITTDADCMHNQNWLGTMLSLFDSKTAFVSGPVQFQGNSSLFNELQKIEFSGLILVGAGLIGINYPIICNAANLGFRKSIYEMVGGYDDNLDLSSGDDEFLMQKIFRETEFKIKFCFNRKAMTFTNPNESLTQFYQQRKRWASKGFYYFDKKIILKLILIFFYYLAIPLQFILSFYNVYFIFFAFTSVILKAIFEYKIVVIQSKNLFPKATSKYFLIAELFHIPYILISGISGIFGNYIWKGRNVKR